MSTCVNIVGDLPELLQRLHVYPDLAQGHFPASQDLIYQGQISRGFFLVLKGMIYMRSRGRGANVASSLETDATFGILLPSINHLNRPMPATIATARASEILFFSRTSLHTQPPLLKILESFVQTVSEPLEALET